MKGRPTGAGAALLLGGLVPSALGLASCTGNEPGPASFQAPRWELAPADLRIEADGSGASLRFVEGVVEGPDGRIHSLHARETFVRSWSAEGRPVGTSGAGEEGIPLPDPQELGVFGDTLWVLDGQTHRIHRFGPAGERIGLLEPSIGVPPDTGAPWDLPPRPRRPLRDGTFLGVTPEVSEAVVRGDQRRTIHVRLETDGTIRDTVWIRTWRPGDVLAVRPGTGTAYGVQPFADAPLSGVATGEVLVVVDRRVSGDEEPPSFHVTWIAMTGDTLSRAPVGYEPEPLADARVGEAVSELVGRWRGFFREEGDSTGADELGRRIRDGLYLPAHLPPVSALVVGTDGSAWLRRPTDESGDAEWWVLDPDGGFRARVPAPSELRILWVGPDHVLGTVVDPSGGSAIVRHPIRGLSAEG